MTFVLKSPSLPHHEPHKGPDDYTPDGQNSSSSEHFEIYICTLQFYAQQIEHHQRINDNLQNAIDNLENALRFRENEIAEYKAELNRIMNSTSWKLTKPLRAIVTIFRK